MTQPISDVAGEQLLEIADRTIVTALARRRPVAPDPSELHVDARRPLGAFVTLHVRGELNGCIGSIEGAGPVGIAVARHAWSAAFADPRLPSLRWSDHPHLEIEISVLSPLSDLPAGTRSELLDALRPGVDGLLIESGTRRAVFLPSVWDQLAEGELFVEHLQRKAGLDPDVWPGDLRAHRFVAQKITRAEPGAVAS